MLLAVGLAVNELWLVCFNAGLTCGVLCLVLGWCFIVIWRGLMYVFGIIEFACAWLCVWRLWVLGLVWVWFLFGLLVLILLYVYCACCLGCLAAVLRFVWAGWFVWLVGDFGISGPLLMLLPGLGIAKVCCYLTVAGWFWV